ncbi:hypothetical protein BJ508DRAFT_361978 [Ascobolus immersus RN42]|uniref:Uncharacterized protein n=1 Tax=Ascobolus immersus RN42 TaxID=1160509 RepID=A0A3N4IB37_ASCIM|nr:hypothetical protein BJ508DRAFT_361978 [Ascobolus immersus RN42]
MPGSRTSSASLTRTMGAKARKHHPKLIMSGSRKKRHKLSETRSYKAGQLEKANATLGVLACDDKACRKLLMALNLTIRVSKATQHPPDRIVPIQRDDHSDRLPKLPSSPRHHLIPTTAHHTRNLEPVVRAHPMHLAGNAAPPDPARTARLNLERALLPSPPDKFLYDIHLQHVHEMRANDSQCSHIYMIGCSLELLYQSFLPAPYVGTIHQTFLPEPNGLPCPAYMRLYRPLQKALRLHIRVVCRTLGHFGGSPHADHYLMGFMRAQEMLDLRRRAGLLREQQVRLVEAVLASHRDDVKRAVRKWEGEERVEKVKFALFTAGSLLYGVCSERFRSERLEGLLIGYLAEEGVNMDVVRGVDAATIPKFDLKAGGLDEGTEEETDEETEETTEEF